MEVSEDGGAGSIIEVRQLHSVSVCITLMCNVIIWKDFEEVERKLQLSAPHIIALTPAAKRIHHSDLVGYKKVTVMYYVTTNNMLL